MNKLLHSKKGITLTELIVSTTLIGIVMLGVVAFSLSIKNIQSATSKSTLLSMRVATAIRQIEKDGINAVGDNGTVGIDYIDAGTTEQLCLRHDTGTLFDSSDDTWICYDHGSSLDLRRCELNAPGGCGSGDPLVLELAQNNFMEVVLDGSGRIDYVNINFVVLYDQTGTFDPMENPEVTMSTRLGLQGITR